MLEDRDQLPIPTPPSKKYRDFDNKKSKKFYKKLRSIQSIDHILSLHKKYEKPSQLIDMWDAFDALSKLIDASDPDTHTPNINHAFQTANGIRDAGEPEWMALVGLIHDLGKMLYMLPQSNDKDGTSLETQYCVVGDTFIAGCKMPDGLVLSEYNNLNPDYHNPRYSSKYGIYTKNVGFDNCIFSYGHDEYLYRTLVYNINNNDDFEWKLPEKALYVIRYHSFYPWHSPLSGHEKDYDHLASPFDHEHKKLLHSFSRYDLYTKKDEDEDFEKDRMYYEKLVKKYIGTTKWLF